MSGLDAHIAKSQSQRFNCSKLAPFEMAERQLFVTYIATISVENSDVENAIEIVVVRIAAISKCWRVGLEIAYKSPPQRICVLMITFGNGIPPNPNT